MHYEGLNRRLDEWVALDRFDLGSHTEEGRMNRSAKRKHDHDEHEEEGELDLATLKEHEEATKVRNKAPTLPAAFVVHFFYCVRFLSTRAAQAHIHLCVCVFC